MSLPEIIRAAALLRSGKLVAFPTETVYGLGADATNGDAVRRIFAAKGRPSTNPLICHVADIATARRYAREWPDAAQKLAERCWPGPLTIVVPKTSEIVTEVTAGLDSVGLRAPNHPLTLQLLRVFDGPLAGPSANRSNHVSPTTAQHVREELDDSIDMILDGGACDVGIESTVLDLSGANATILRPGGICREEIESIIGPVDVASGVVASAATPIKSPGQHARHYAPRSPAYRFDSSNVSRLPSGACILPISSDPKDYGKHFYAKLRDLDAKLPPAIYIEMPPDDPRWLAVRDRIARATEPLP